MNSQIITNKHWEEYQPRVTIITPVYNRRKELPRAIQSVKKQVYRNFEYIIIDDGSTETVDDIVEDLMETADFPVMFIKKENGGVHTARNKGYEYGRGEFVLCCDSDDEITEDSLQIFLDIWETIPTECRNEYWEIVARCRDQHGKGVGWKFPANINDLNKEEAEKIRDELHAECSCMRVLSILKKDPFPEPKGVTFMTENVLWKKLGKRYKSFYINDEVRIYHTETENSLSTKNYNKNLQNVKNSMWETSKFINDYYDYQYGFKAYMMMLIRHGIMRHIGNEHHVERDFARLSRTSAKVLSLFFWIPTWVGAQVYKKRRMK